MKISPRDILIATVIGVILIAVVLVVLLILPQNARLKEIDQQITQAQTQASEAATLLNRRQEAKNQASMTSAELIRLANAVPESPELPSFIIELQDLCASSGLQLRSLTPAQPASPWVADQGAPEPGYLRIPMTLQVLGTWSDTVDFLNRMQRIPRQVRITRVNSQYVEPENLQKPFPESVPKVPILTDIEIEAYMIPEDASAAASTPATATGQ